MSGTPRPPLLRKSYSKSGVCQAIRANALVKTRVHLICRHKVEEGLHLAFLVRRGIKEIREATPGEEARDLRLGVGLFSRRTADTSDIGTCELSRSGERLVPCQCTARKEGLKDTHTGRREIDVEIFEPLLTDAVIAARD